MASKVNLDALIRREDFEIENPPNSSTGTDTTTIRLEDLKKTAFFFSAVRKPDFQRETSEWSPEKIAGLIESYVTGDLIPAVILWQSGGFTFVIDGSHRLSALAAWVNDDYGDGSISKKFYDGIIQEDQYQIADRARVTIRRLIGSYSDYQLAITDPERVDKKIVDRARDLGRLAIQLQWVKGDASKAEESFFKINQEASHIDKTELVLLKNRRKPNCLAARAIRRSGTGHKYWSEFDPEKQEAIEKIAKEINDICFVPPLKTPIKTLDLPVAGKIYSTQTLPLILNFINIANEVNDNEDPLEDDKTGDVTLQYLGVCKRIALKINSTDSGSLGLHPAVYLYSKDGNYKFASFYAVVALILEFEKHNALINKFIKNRRRFEEILLEYDYFIAQIVQRFRRSAMRSYPSVKEFYLFIIQRLDLGESKEKIISDLMKDPKFNYLTIQKTETIKDIDVTKDFPTTVKSEAFMKEALSNSVKCKICGGYIHKNSISIDHIKRKEDGGLGTIDNAQISHPYCNTTYKN
jgi:hypothetical protein